jgi:hypothetical protein
MEMEEGFCVIAANPKDSGRVPYLSSTLFPTRQQAHEHSVAMMGNAGHFPTVIEFRVRPKTKKSVLYQN